ISKIPIVIENNEYIVNCVIVLTENNFLENEAVTENDSTQRTNDALITEERDFHTQNDDNAKIYLIMSDLSSLSSLSSHEEEEPRRIRMIRDRNNPMDELDDFEFKIRFRFSKQTVMDVLHLFADDIKA
ncbi:hypothetical protein ILUMI_16927, partial [Ignelater luminosus]